MGERYQLDVILTESYWDVRPLSFCYWAFNRHIIYLSVIISSLFFVSKLKLEPSVIMWMVPKVGKLVSC
jgi:hypothetical protein